MFGPINLETTLDLWGIEGELTATIEYTAIREGRYFDIEVGKTAYFIDGKKYEPSVEFWKKLEQLCQRNAEKHFFTLGEVA